MGLLDLGGQRLRATGCGAGRRAAARPSGCARSITAGRQYGVIAHPPADRQFDPGAARRQGPRSPHEDPAALGAGAVEGNRPRALHRARLPPRGADPSRLRAHKGAAPCPKGRCRRRSVRDAAQHLWQVHALSDTPRHRAAAGRPLRAGWQHPCSLSHRLTAAFGARAAVCGSWRRSMVMKPADCLVRR